MNIKYLNLFFLLQALRIKLTCLGGETVGNTVNLMSNDVNRFDMAPLFLHYLWIAPLQCGVITFFIYMEMGMASLYGMLAVIMVSPLQSRCTILKNCLYCHFDFIFFQFFFSKSNICDQIVVVSVLLSMATSYLRVKAASRTDARVRHMNEIIQAIQVIKMYAWENPFIEVISLLRR